MAFLCFSLIFFKRSMEAEGEGGGEVEPSTSPHRFFPLSMST